MCFLVLLSQSADIAVTWKEAENMPEKVSFAQAVYLNEAAYIGGGGYTNTTIQVYDVNREKWKTHLQSTANVNFAVTSINSQLVIVGGRIFPSQIAVLNAADKWENPYPAMPTGRRYLAAVSYHQFIIAACGTPRVRLSSAADMNTVEILDTTIGKWFTADPVPKCACCMSSAVADGMWYLSGDWSDNQPHVFSVCLPALVSRAVYPTDNTVQTPPWQELPPPPVKLPTIANLRGALLAIGGKGYMKDIHKFESKSGLWVKIGELPVGLVNHCCALLPSGDLFVAGGENLSKKSSNKTWIVSFENI